MAALEIEDVHVHIGQSYVLQGVNLSMKEDPIAVVIGRNGMGKTTLCKTIMGLHKTTGGSIRFGGSEITQMKPSGIARLGIGYVPQGRRLFPSLTVDEHLRLVDTGAANRPWTIKRVYELFPRLEERKRSFANTLSGGEQQMLALGRALVSDSSLLVMDEPTEGLAPSLVDKMIQTFREIANGGIRILLIEQNLRVATSVAERVAIMLNGRIALELSSDRLLQDEETKTRYLGLSTTH